VENFMADDNAPVFKDNPNAPFIYFNIAQSFGVIAGAIEVELVARSLIPSTGTLTAEFVTIARLRCSPLAAASLRDALNSVLDLAKKVQEEGIAAAAASTAKLN
jgi:hypothetical protein